MYFFVPGLFQSKLFVRFTPVNAHSHSFSIAIYYHFALEGPILKLVVFGLLPA